MSGCEGKIYRMFTPHLPKLSIQLNASYRDVVSQVLDEMPPDPTSLEDMIHAALFSGQPLEVLRYASQLDQWLSAHLADLMVPLSLIETEIDEE